MLEATWTAECSKCKVTATIIARDFRIAVIKAQNAGWVVREHENLCPKCRQEMNEVQEIQAGIEDILL